MARLALGSRRRRSSVVAIGAAAGVVAAGLHLAPAHAAFSRTTVGTTTVFAEVPAPGHPFGVLATDEAVYVATGAASPFSPNPEPEAVFRYDAKGGSPIVSVSVHPMHSTPGAHTMGLHDIAEDGDGRIYVVDMNSRILRFTPRGRGLSGPEVYATVPEPYATLGWGSSMWQNLAFDRDGSLYVTDASLGAIWRIKPDRAPTIWLQCAKFSSLQIAGLNGIAFGPDRSLYVTQISGPDAGNVAGGWVYRLPPPGSATAAAPSCDAAEVFHEFEADPAGRPAPFPSPCDLAFARSGNMYVTLNAHNAVSVVAPDGRERRRLSSDLFDVPIGIRFHRDSVLVASSNYLPPENAEHWRVLEVFVGEPGLPLMRPRLPPRA